MVRAFILVECKPGEPKTAVQALRDLEGVKLVDATLGPYDVILLAEKPDAQAMMNFVTDEVQAAPGVERTTTCLSVKLA